MLSAQVSDEGFEVALHRAGRFEFDTFEHLLFNRSNRLLALTQYGPSLVG